VRTSEFSLRTQNIALHGACPTSDQVVLPGNIVGRSFLGESWDYAFQSDASDLRLRIMSPPRHVFDVGQKVWLEIDPSHIVPIQDDQHA
jgi:hypothetical protein